MTKVFFKNIVLSSATKALRFQKDAVDFALADCGNLADTRFQNHVFNLLTF